MNEPNTRNPAERRRHRGGDWNRNPAADKRRPPPWGKPRIGQALYRENLVVCHDIDWAQSKKFGPRCYPLDVFAVGSALGT
jgi:hypothetical protein